MHFTQLKIKKIISEEIVEVIGVDETDFGSGSNQTQETELETSQPEAEVKKEVKKEESKLNLTT